MATTRRPIVWPRAGCALKDLATGIPTGTKTQLHVATTLTRLFLLVRKLKLSMRVLV